MFQLIWVLITKIQIPRTSFIHNLLLTTKDLGMKWGMVIGKDVSKHFDN